MGRAKARPRRVELAEAYLRDLADRLCLRDWTIAVETEPAKGKDGDEIYAEVSTIDGHHANVSLSLWFWAATPEKQREVCTHELGHLSHHQFDTVTAQIRAACDEPVAAAITKAMDDAEEHAVQHFARVVGPSLPLPPKFNARGTRR